MGSWGRLEPPDRRQANGRNRRNLVLVAHPDDIGRRDEARALFINLLARRNAFGLLSEDIHPETSALWGNIPQTYSMAGIINSAMRLSIHWEDAWCRV
jgi:GH15 family glucan-1,4-alpha-glucosidase